MTDEVYAAYEAGYSEGLAADLRLVPLRELMDEIEERLSESGEEISA